MTAKGYYHMTRVQRYAYETGVSLIKLHAWQKNDLAPEKISKTVVFLLKFQ
jgi:hypothetical protein